MRTYAMPFTATPRRYSAYWADADPAYIAGQQALGRDTSEYKPEIRERVDGAKHAARMAWDRRFRAAMRSGDPDLFGGHFGAQRMPWYRRLAIRLRGFDA
jgi:hypothetical protein